MSRRLARFVPSRRSLAIGAGIVVLAAGGYAIARETSLFAISRVDVTGGSAAVDAQVVRALTPLVGRSLVGLDGTDVLQQTEALPTIVSATYDRAFPNTLHVMIVAERPVAVLRDGTAAWLVSARGRVIQPVAVGGAKGLPRIWLAEKAVRAGVMLPAQPVGAIARALAAAGQFRSHIAVASFVSGVLVFHLRTGVDLVLGSPADVPLKVAVAGKVMRQLPLGTRSIDVSVPSRVVTSSQPTSS